MNATAPDGSNPDGSDITDCGCVDWSGNDDSDLCDKH